MISAAILASCIPNANQEVRDVTNQQQDSVGVYMLDGQETDMHLLIEEGNPAIINFWAASCAFCRVELPWFQELANEYKNLQIVAVNMQEPESLVRSYWNEGGYTFPTLLDPKNTLRKRYKVSLQPTTLFIDSSGRIVSRKDGPLTKDELIMHVSEIYPFDNQILENTESLIPYEETISASPVPDILSSWYEGMVSHAIPLEKIFSGGPDKDGIPAIDEPQFDSSSIADEWLRDDEMGILVSEAGVAKFYPYKILNWHEIVNDTIGSNQIFVTYCPLCATGVVYESLIPGGTSQFGVSGLLYQSNLLMYDKQTDSLWNQATGEAVVGPLARSTLAFKESSILEYGQAKELHKNLLVLNTNTGFDRDYNADPYTGYEDRRDTIFPTDAWDRASELHPKTLVYGIEIDGNAKAYPISYIQEMETIVDQINAIPISINYDETGLLTVLRTDSNEVVKSLPIYWFAWVAQYPDTVLVQ